MGSLSSRYPSHPRPLAAPPLLYGVCDWKGIERDPRGINPRFTAILLPRTPSLVVNRALVTRHATLAAAQAYADKLNAREYPPELEGPIG